MFSAAIQVYSRNSISNITIDNIFIFNNTNIFEGNIICNLFLLCFKK
jgi:hypothetical protein